MKNYYGKRVYALLLLLAVLYIVPQIVKADVTQRVIVKEYIPDVKNPTLNANKKPLPFVEVSVKGAGSTITDENGECSLNFNLLKGGDRIVVRHFMRPGYELLNPELLNDLVIRRDDKPLEIVMISQDNAIKLSRIISQQVGAQFDKMRLRELNELDILAVDYEKKRKAIIEKYELKLDDVDQYIDRLVRVDITRVTKNESDAFKAFADGDLDQALALFEEEDLIAQYRKTYTVLENVKEAHQKVDEERDSQRQQQKDIQYFLKTQITMLEMEGSEKSMRKAKDLLEQLLELDPFGEYQGKEYIMISIAMKDFEYVKAFIRTHLEDPDLSLDLRCRLAINLATAFYEEKKFEDVLQLLKPFESVMDEICNRRSDEPLYIYLPVLARQMMGHCESMFGSRERAVMQYQKMFDIYLKLRQVDSMTKFYANATYPRLIRAIRQLGEMGEWELAETIYSTAYPRVEMLYSQGSLRERLLWGRFRYAKAITLFRQNQLDEGMRIIFTLIPEVEQIYQKNRPICDEFYQLLLYRATDYYCQNKRFIDAVKMSQKWFEVAQKPYSPTQLPPLAETLDEQTLNDYKTMCKMFEFSIAQMPRNP